MIDKLKHATLSAIYVRKVFCYDDTKTDELVAFCSKFNISYLPSSDKRCCYNLKNGRFERCELNEQITCSPREFLFDDSTIKKFENGNQDEVLFVIENDIIKGVVHISDYNSEFIYSELYKLIYHFEKNIRKLLILHGESNETFLSPHFNEILDEEKINSLADFKRQIMKYKSNNTEKNLKLQQQRDNCKTFETFQLKDLLSFCYLKDYISNVSVANILSICDLRNTIAHNKEFAKRKSINEIETPLYNLNSLKKFINGLYLFFDAYEEVDDILKRCEVV